MTNPKKSSVQEMEAAVRDIVSVGIRPPNKRLEDYGVSIILRALDTLLESIAVEVEGSTGRTLNDYDLGTNHGLDKAAALIRSYINQSL